MPDGARLDATGASLAAGIMFMTDDARVLLVRRAGADHDGEWAFPGGSLESGETAEQAAIRECFEELGDVVPEGIKLVEWMRRVQEGVDFTTFLGRVKEPFVPVLNSEHSEYQWCALKELIDPSPEPAVADAVAGPPEVPRADDNDITIEPKPGDFIEFLDDRFTDKGPATGEVISLHDGFVGVSWGAGETAAFAWDKLAPVARRSSGLGRAVWLVGEARRYDALDKIIEVLALNEIKRKVSAIVKD